MPDEDVESDLLSRLNESETSTLPYNFSRMHALQTRLVGPQDENYGQFARRMQLIRSMASNQTNPHLSLLYTEDPELWYELAYEHPLSPESTRRMYASLGAAADLRNPSYSSGFFNSVGPSRPLPSGYVIERLQSPYPPIPKYGGKRRRTYKKPSKK
jgi:hypothetical protein